MGPDRATGLTSSHITWDILCTFVIEGTKVIPDAKRAKHEGHTRFQPFSLFSPQPFFIGGLFLPQQILLAVWLYKLSHKTQNNDAVALEDSQTMVDYTPFYAVGNFCIASKCVS